MSPNQENGKDKVPQIRKKGTNFLRSYVNSIFLHCTGTKPRGAAGSRGGQPEAWAGPAGGQPAPSSTQLHPSHCRKAIRVGHKKLNACWTYFNVFFACEDFLD